MSFKPRQRLEYALQLQSNAISDECHFRATVHQAYYAALNQLQYEIDNRLFFPMDGKDRFEKSHQAVLDACANQVRKLASNDAKRGLVNSVLQNMKRARALRTDADYRLDLPIVDVHANAAIKYALQIFDDLERYT